MSCECKGDVTPIGSEFIWDPTELKKNWDSASIRQNKKIKFQETVSAVRTDTEIAENSE